MAMTANALPFGLAFAQGVGLGLCYFGGLWWTVRQLATARHPALWLIGSFVLRASVSLVGFYLVLGGGAARLMVCLVGFFVARTILVRGWLPMAAKSAAQERP
jgi:F1F0 ATPase subunit 2